MKKKPLEYALYLIEMRDRSVNEIRQKMEQKEYLPEDIEKTVQFLLDKDFLNDERFVESYIKQLQFRSQGIYKIRMQLARFGLERELIEEKLGEIDSEAEYEKAKELAINWMAKKGYSDASAGASTPEIRRKKYEKVGRFLAGRGYSLDIVKKILNELLK